MLLSSLVSLSLMSGSEEETIDLTVIGNALQLNSLSLDFFKINNATQLYQTIEKLNQLNQSIVITVQC